jgi:fatty acid desaturase
LLLPLRIHRKIHAFHHAHNRRDPETSALDTFVVTGPATPLRRCRCRAQWYLAVFAGGWFLHGLVSVLLFLALPLRLAQRVSPAFRGWTHRDQLRSIGAFALGLALHFGVGVALGAGAWLRLLGGPLLVFAWVYSLLVYIYHYDTGYGPAVRAHVRSAGAGPVFSWWLLNFGEHATHHADPRLPWWSLPEHAVEAPRPRIGAAVLAQLRGPRILERGRTQWT